MEALLYIAARPIREWYIKWATSIAEYDPDEKKKRELHNWPENMREFDPKESPESINEDQA